MITTRLRGAVLAVTTAAVLPLALSACSSDDGGKDTKDSAAASSSVAREESKGTADDAAGPGDRPFGTACASVPENGAGSFDGMSKDPVATAASNNPALSTLVTAVKKAGLVDTLNNARDITVFAPTDDAFAKIPKEELDKVLADKATLTKILTYHVVGRKLTSAQLSDGTYPTLEKSTLTTKGSGESYTVNDTARVVCGDVRTANATVHIVDSVLMPAM
ncbi:fasciclin domain-containing protein [Streptomyces sp. NPDC056909]|uniref:fasciclin domain-containing protein n=1 Tax=Streptomyces sp. NPDC056909 TaxID=3345963 RepID=UPI0036AD6288